MKKIKASKKRIIITTAALMAVGGGAAFAYWTAMGNGTGTATTGEATELAITGSAAGALYPGGAAQKISYTVTNSGDATQQLSEVTAAVNPKWTNEVEGLPACTPNDFDVVSGAITPVQIEGKDSYTVSAADSTITIAMKNLSTNQDACQGIKELPLVFTSN